MIWHNNFYGEKRTDVKIPPEKDKSLGIYFGQNGALAVCGALMSFRKTLGGKRDDYF